MGSNGSYCKSIGGVPQNNRSHTDTGMRIQGHKVLLQTGGRGQAKNILYSNSESPIYIIGKQLQDGSVEVHSLNIFDGHKIGIEVNLKYDKKGNLKPYNGTDSGSHCHYWEEKSEGSMGRKFSGNNHEPIQQKYMSLINDIVSFNKQKKEYHG